MPKKNLKPVTGMYGKPWSQMFSIDISQEVLEKLGKCLVRHISHEAREEFKKRGWSEWDDDHQVKISKSFSYKILGVSTIKILTNFSHIQRLLDGQPARRMKWVSQQYKDAFPNKFDLTPKEKELGMKKGGRLSKGQRLPLIVPIEKDGTVIFRSAPFSMGDAWIHPGIAKFSFLNRGMRKGKKACAQIILEEVKKQLREGDPTK